MRLYRWHFSKKFDDFARFGEASGLQFREDHFPVRFDFKRPAAAGNQPRRDAQNIPQFVRQTGGSRLIPSHRAIRNCDVHACFLHFLSEKSRLVMRAGATAAAAALFGVIVMMAMPPFVDETAPN